MSKRHHRPAPEAVYAVPYPQVVAPAPYPPHNAAVGIQTLSAKNATVTHVQVTKPKADWSGNEYQFEASESAKREQGDRYDPLTGELLSLSRAFQRLSRQMAHEANKRIQAGVREQQQALLDKLTKPSKGQVHHRTLEEWQEIQRRKAQEGAEQIAENLGMTRDQFITAEELRQQYGAPDVRTPAERVAEWGGDRRSTEVIRLADGQTLVVGNDVVEIEDEASGEVVAHFHRVK